MMSVTVVVEISDRFLFYLASLLLKVIGIKVNTELVKGDDKRQRPL